MIESKAYLVQCAWCYRALKPGCDPKGQQNWHRVHARIPEGYTISHGICPKCKKDMENELTTQGVCPKR